MRSAIEAVYRHNFRRDFRDHVNTQRTYVLNDEAGLVLCSGPGGPAAPPVLYSDEVWTGIEYQVAAHLILEADDKLIAFTRVPVGQEMFANPSAEMFVVPHQGDAKTEAQRLAANDPPACSGKSSPGINNHWPKWSPDRALASGTGATTG